MRHFQCLKSSVGNPLAVEKEPRSIAPQGAKLWLFKEVNHLRNLVKISNLCSNTCFSGLEWNFETIKNLQGVQGIVDSGKVLLWACFETSGAPEGLYVTPRLGTNYF